MSTPNPYRTPVAPVAGLERITTPGACPRCGSQTALKVRFTWWGGALGPRIFHVVRCVACNRAYNGKTGATLTWAIVVYQGVAMAITLALLAAYLYFALGAGE